MGRDEVTPIGVAPSELIERLAGRFDGTLRYRKEGTSSRFSLRILPAGDALFIDRTYKVNDDVTLGCEDELLIPSTIELVSEDGWIHETIAGQLRAIAGGYFFFEEEIAAEDFQGDYDISWAPIREGEVVTYGLAGYAQDDGALSGAFIGTAMGESPPADAPPGEPVSMLVLTIADWAASRAPTPPR